MVKSRLLLFFFFSGLDRGSNTMDIRAMELDKHGFKSQTTECR